MNNVAVTEAGQKLISENLLDGVYGPLADMLARQLDVPEFTRLALREAQSIEIKRDKEKGTLRVSYVCDNGVSGHVLITDLAKK